MSNIPRHNAEVPNFVMENNISHLKVIGWSKRFSIYISIFLHPKVNIVSIIILAT